MSQLGYEVDIVDNGAAALDAVATTRYSAVLMDCHMPVMDDYVSKPVDVTALRAVLRHCARPDPTVPPPSVTGEPVSGHDSDSALDSERLALLRRLGPGDGWGLLPGAADVFLELAPRLVATMREAKTRGDSDGFVHSAHELEGVAANLGAVTVASLCQRLEAASAAGTVENDDLDALESEHGRAGRLLRELLPSPR